MRGEEWGQIRSTVAGSGPGREGWAGLEERQYTHSLSSTYPAQKRESLLMRLYSLGLLGLLTVRLDSVKGVKVSLSQDYHMPLVVKGDKFINGWSGKTCGVKQP